MTSVNTNASATTALRTLQQTNKALETTQNRIATGLKIGEAKDNAAYWSISTTLKSDNKSLTTVKDALNLGSATVDTAYQGLNKAKEVLDEIKSKLTAATQDGVDRSKIQSEVVELQKQLQSIASASTFSGENWLSVNSQDATYNANKSVVSSFARTNTGGVEIGTIGINISEITLFDSSPNATGILDGQTVLKSGSTFLSVGGNNKADAPTAGTLSVGAMTGGAAAGTATAKVAALGTLNLSTVRAGDKISFSLTSGTNTGTVVLNTTGLTEGNFEASLQGAVDAALGGTLGGGTNKALVKVDAITKAVTIASVGTGPAAVLTVGTISGVDADGVTTASAGLLTNASLPAPVAGTATPAQVNAGTFTGAAVSGTDTLTFDLQYGLQTFSISHTFTADAGGVDATEFTAILQGKIDTALAGVTGYAAGDVNVEIPASGSLSGKIVLTTEEGAGFAVGVYNVGGTTPLGLQTSQSTAAGSTSSAVVGYGTSSAATMSVGTFDNAGITPGDKISFQLNLKSGVVDNIKTVEISTDGFSGILADRPADAAKFQAKVQAALDAQFTANQVTFSVDPSTREMKFTTVALGSDKQVIFGNVVTTNGDGVATGPAGLTAASATGGLAGSVGSNATVATTAPFTATQTFGDGDSVSFQLAVGSTSRTVTINKAAVNAALGSSANGTITNADDYVTVVRKAAETAGFNVTTDLTVTKGSSNEVVFTKATAGGTIGVTGQTLSAGSAADTISVEQIDVTDAALTALGVTTADRKNVLTAYISVVNEALNKVTTAASNLGAVSKRIELQQTFVDTLMDTIDKGVGNLVDADLSEESTRLQALQTKQQLGVQALSIANQGTQQILRLFQ